MIKKGRLHMIKGSCCCGRIKFQLKEKPLMMGTCHCSRCRKASGGTFVFVTKESLEWVEGKDFVATYIPNPPFKYNRNFCSSCGTSLGEILSSEKSFPISAHCLDDDPEVRNQFHEFVESKPAWSNICDDSKQFSEHPLK
jgi:hypothetical protein